MRNLCRTCAHLVAIDPDRRDLLAHEAGGRLNIVVGQEVHLTHMAARPLGTCTSLLTNQCVHMAQLLKHDNRHIITDARESSTNVKHVVVTMGSCARFRPVHIERLKNLSSTRTFWRQ